MERGELGYWVGFNIASGIGPVRFRQLRLHFGSLVEAWNAPPEELRRAGLAGRAIQGIITAREKLSLEEELEKVERAGARVITWEDQEYPPRLKHIQRPPPVLYVRGELLPDDEWSVAVVGTRSRTDYGREVTWRLVQGLVKSELTIVSGLARGIDSIGHQAALAAGGRTVAVLGSGVDVIYPREHTKLAEEIVQSGAVISECPVGTAPEARNFPARNRIISGMSLGTLVVEAPRGSGALITARWALEQGREVFAVPGSIFHPGSFGTNELIMGGGAKLVLSVRDILEELGPEVMLGAVREEEAPPVGQMALPQTGEREDDLLKHISYAEPQHIDDIGRASGLSIAEVSGLLTLLELKGLVRQVGPMRYVRGQVVVVE